MAENKELKAYIESLTQHFIALQQQRQVQFLEKKSTPQKYKVVYKEESESELEPEQEEDKEFENEAEVEIKKTTPKRKKVGNNIFDYINKNPKRHEQ